MRVIETRLEKLNDEDTPFDMAPTGDSDGYILMLVHEHFHGFQAKHGSREEGVEGLRNFEVNGEYATYSHIEGLALMNAYYHEEQGEALEYFKDYLVARELKHRFMPPEAAAGESYISLVEGPPTYVSLKMAMLLEVADYEPGISREINLFFFNYKYVRSYYENLLKKGLYFAAEWTLDKRGKYYLYGAYQCFLLDRFVPGWKKDFFRGKRSLDELSAELLNLSEKERKSISSRLRTRYSFDEIFAKHDALIKTAKREKGR